MASALNMTASQQLTDTRIELSELHKHNQYKSDMFNFVLPSCVFLFLSPAAVFAADDLSTVSDSRLVDSFILFWASQCSMSAAGTPSMATMMSPAHRLACEALLPGVIWMGEETRTTYENREAGLYSLSYTSLQPAWFFRQVVSACSSSLTLQPLTSCSTTGLIVQLCLFLFILNWLECLCKTWDLRLFAESNVQPDS